MKKGMELSINIIVIAAIALIVMFVMIYIFIGKMADTRQDLNKTQSQYGPNTCNVPGSGRSCSGEKACLAAGGFIYPKPQGGWKDCYWVADCCSVEVK